MSQFTTELALGVHQNGAENNSGRVCRKCGIATCTETGSGHQMQPNGILTHRFSPRYFTYSIDSCTVRKDEDPDHAKFIRMLIACGLAQLAEAYRIQVVEGKVSPEQIKLNQQEFIIYHSEQAGRTDITNEKGELSEYNLELWLSDRGVFPWIADIIKAPESNPGYDFTIVLNQSHPIAKMLGMTQLYIDAKSSRGGVAGYFEKNVRRKNKRARLTEVILEGIWVINSNDKLDYQLLDAQLVTLLLMTVGKFNKPALWKDVFRHLDPRLKLAFEQQPGMVNSMKKLILNHKN